MIGSWFDRKVGPHSHMRFVNQMDANAVRQRAQVLANELGAPVDYLKAHGLMNADGTLARGLTIQEASDAVRVMVALGVRPGRPR